MRRMRGFAGGLAALGLTACSITVPVAVIGGKGEVLRGEATSSLASGGSFHAANATVQCDGRYDISSGSPTVSLAVRCSDGRSGVGRALRDTRTSGSGDIHMSDGTDAHFVFGEAAAAF